MWGNESFDPKHPDTFGVLLQIPPEEIGETILVDNELSRESEEEKLGILDVHVLLRDGTQMDMEMQVLATEYWDQRSTFYLSKMYTGQLKRGQPYSSLKKCIQVNVLNFELFPEEETCYEVFQLLGVTTGRRSTEDLEIQVLELSKLSKKCKGPDEVIAWMKFFRGGTSKELKEVAEGNDYMEEAYRDLINMSKDEAKRLEYEAREKAWRDYQAMMEGAEHRGIKRGLERGIEIGRRQAREELLAVLIEFCQQGVLTSEQAAEKANMPVEEFCKLLSCH